MDARAGRLLELHRHRGDDVDGRRPVLPRPEIRLGDAYLLGMVHDLLLHGFPGEVDPEVRGDDLRRVERDALRPDPGRRGRPGRRRRLPARPHGVQPDVHRRGHRQVRRGIPAVRPLGIDDHRLRRRRRLCHPGRFFRRHPDRHPPDRPDRRRRCRARRHGLPGRAGRRRPGPEGCRLGGRRPDLAALALVPGDDGAELPALLALRPDPHGRVLLDDVPGAGRAERLGFPVLPDDAHAPRRRPLRRAVDGGLHAALDHRLRLHAARDPVSRRRSGVRRRKDHAARPEKIARWGCGGCSWRCCSPP